MAGRDVQVCEAQCRSLIEVLVNVRSLEPYDYPNTMAFSPQGPKSEMMMLADKDYDIVLMFHPPASPLYPVQNVLYPCPMPAPCMFPFLHLRRPFVFTGCGSEALRVFDENSAVSQPQQVGDAYGMGVASIAGDSVAATPDVSTNTMEKVLC